MSARNRFFASCIAAATALTACTDAIGPGGDVDPITELPRPLTAQEESVISGANAFGLDLLSRVAAEDDQPNVVISPLSASMALGMTLNGAATGTFDAMRSTLGFGGLSLEQVNASYRSLIDLLTDLDPNVDFGIANSVWANQDVSFAAQFFADVEAAFDAAAESRDFSDSGTVSDINDWVDENTDGMIDRIIDRLDPQLVMLLINAIYFDGAWTTQFDPADTREQDFTRADGSTVTVDMMRMDDATVWTGGGADYQAMELPYGGGAYSMVIVLPAQGSVRDFVSGLDAAKWQSIVSGLSERELDLIGLPKFTVEWDGYLNDPLRDMGMDVAFRPGADFTRMAPGRSDLCIDFVRQKTFMEVDERGTRAAAVTSVGVGVTSFSGFLADRPFVFALRERLSGTLLFTGIIGDPTAESEEAEEATSTCR